MAVGAAVRRFKHLIVPTIQRMGLWRDADGYLGAGIRGIGDAVRLYRPRRGPLGRFVACKIRWAIRDEELLQRPVKRSQRPCAKGRLFIGGDQGLKELADLPTPGNEGSEELEREEFWRMVEEAAGDTVNRRIVRLMFREGWGPVAIAREMGTYPGLIDSRRRAILRRIRPAVSRWLKGH